MKEQQKGNTTTAAATAAATATTRSGSKTTTRLNTENWIPKTEYPITRIPKTECWILNIEHCILDWMPTAKLDHNLQIFIFGFSVFSLFFALGIETLREGDTAGREGEGSEEGRRREQSPLAWRLGDARCVCCIISMAHWLIDWWPDWWRRLQLDSH